MNLSRYIELVAMTLLSFAAYFWIGYGLERRQFGELLLCFAVAFLAYVFLMRSKVASRGLLVIGLALVFRLLFLFSTPELSDDYHRFVWDGRLINLQESPFELPPESIPDQIKDSIDPAGELLEGMNSQSYYSVYPPFNQLFFAVAVFVGGDIDNTLIVFRLMLIIAELALITLLWGICSRTGRQRWVGLYALNPLVIVEVSGNLHFEGLVALFLVAGVYSLWRKRSVLAGIALGLAAGLKLTPFIFFPAIWRYAGWRRGVMVVVVAVLAFLALGWWMLNPSTVLNIFESIQLYFRSFEFNASVYYVAREMGEWTLGYNPIAVTGIALPLIGAVAILGVSFRKTKRRINQLCKTLVLVGTAYLFFATTVHPWYLIPILALAVPTRLIFPWVWSAMIVLSYSAYQADTYQENLYLVFSSYAVVVFVAFFEWYRPLWAQRILVRIWDDKP